MLNIPHSSIFKLGKTDNLLLRFQQLQKSWPNLHLADATVFEFYEEYVVKIEKGIGRLLIAHKACFSHTNLKGKDEIFYLSGWEKCIAHLRIELQDKKQSTGIEFLYNLSEKKALKKKVKDEVNYDINHNALENRLNYIDDLCEYLPDVTKFIRTFSKTAMNIEYQYDIFDKFVLLRIKKSEFPSQAFYNLQRQSHFSADIKLPGNTVSLIHSIDENDLYFQIDFNLNFHGSMSFNSAFKLALLDIIFCFPPRSNKLKYNLPIINSNRERYSGKKSLVSHIPVFKE